MGTTAQFTYMHEHIPIDLAGAKNNPDCRLDCQAQVITELRDLRDSGVDTMVNVSCIGMGRSVEYARAVAAATGLRIIMATGFYKEPFFPALVEQKTVRELAALMVAEIVQGIEGSRMRAALIGEIGTSKNVMTALEEKVFAASALAQHETGVPISTHTTLGTHALQQVKFLQAHGVDLSRVIIGHMDLSNDFTLIKQLLDYGVTVAFDTIGKSEYLSDAQRSALLLRLLQAGYAQQVVLSMDITRKSQLRHNGGVGYGYLLTHFVPQLLAQGASPAHIHQLLATNPRKFFAAA